mmetsp:Transcript_38992/g.97577  ORF Transcript_38992/g.97577 Transcript_38992/m.97577 type:complete len:225 (-) Transcript_38992:11-685(-)
MGVLPEAHISGASDWVLHVLYRWLDRLLCVLRILRTDADGSSHSLCCRLFVWEHHVDLLHRLPRWSFQAGAEHVSPEEVDRLRHIPLVPHTHTDLLFLSSSGFAARFADRAVRRVPVLCDGVVLPLIHPVRQDHGNKDTGVRWGVSGRNPAEFISGVCVYNKYIVCGHVCMSGWISQWLTHGFVAWLHGLPYVLSDNSAVVMDAGEGPDVGEEAGHGQLTQMAG